MRFLMPLAFVAPKVIAAIADGTAPADFTVTRLAKGLPSKWSDQAEIHWLSRNVQADAARYSVDKLTGHLSANPLAELLAFWGRRPSAPRSCRP